MPTGCTPVVAEAPPAQASCCFRNPHAASPGQAPPLAVSRILTCCSPVVPEALLAQTSCCLRHPHAASLRPGAPLDLSRILPCATRDLT